MIAAAPNVRLKIAERPDIDDALLMRLSTAAREFMKDSDLGRGVDPLGYYEATMDAMQRALDGSGELWIGKADSELVIYILAGVSMEVDNRPTYWVSQAWVRKDERGQPWVKEAWAALRRRAIDLGCAHIVTISGRENNQAYCRFLGKGWHVYGTLLKEDLNG